MKTDPVMNALADFYASQLFDVISSTSGADGHFYVEVCGEPCRMDVNSVQELREILDSTLIETLVEKKGELAARFLADCVGSNEPTAFGYEIWFSVLRDIGATLSAAGGFYA